MTKEMNDILPCPTCGEWVDAEEVEDGRCFDCDMIFQSNNPNIDFFDTVNLTDFDI